MTNRILVSIVIEALIFFVTAILAIVNSSQWPDAFFAITIVSVVLINVANGVYQNCVFGVTAILPMKYTNAVVTGMNISGVVSSVIMIISIASTPNPMTSALAYFMTAVIFLIICYGSYIYIGKNVSSMKIFSGNHSSSYHFQEFFKQSYSNQIQKDRSDSAQTMVTNDNGNSARWANYIHIAKEVWPQLFNVFFTYFVSLSIFPSVLVTTKSTSDNLGNYWNVIVCFLSFNFWAMIGNILVDLVGPKIPPNRLWIMTVARVIFIPFFLFCNAKPDKRTWPVLFPQDWIYALGVLFMALTSGYTGSLAMVYTPISVSDSSNASTAGMMASFSLMIGILAGILFSNVLTYIITI